MQIQRSFVENREVGTLYLVPTPIGNLEDMTFRAIKIMNEASVIAAEDTRNSKKLCNYYDINTPIISYHQHNYQMRGDEILIRLKNGESVALVSDAGMPCISDPGYELVISAIQENIPVIPLPGANAALTALIASGIQPQPFFFYGFLPREKKEKIDELTKLKKQIGTLILYEAPHRLKETLQMMYDIFGNRQIVVSRELTKKFEEFTRGTLQEVIESLNNMEMRGEFCLIIEGMSGQLEIMEEMEEWWSDLNIVDHVQFYIDQKGWSSKEAIKQTSLDRKMRRRDVYQAFHIGE